MLLGSSLGKRLEPVSVVSSPHLHGPLLHTLSHSIGYRAIKTGTIIYHIDEFAVHICRQILIHLLTSEHILAEIL